MSPNINQVQVEALNPGKNKHPFNWGTFLLIEVAGVS